MISKFYQIMKNLSSLGALSLFLLLSSALPANAEEPGIIVNEIAWMGTTNSANDEWMELYNNTADTISLDGWILKSADGTPEIKLSGTIPANGFFLLERTDDNTVPGATADQIYKGALGNSGENLKLYDNTGKIADEVDCSSGWLAGNNSAKQTMERIFSGWQTSESPNGTPKSQNSAGIATIKIGAEQKTELPPVSSGPVEGQTKAATTDDLAKTKPLQVENYPNGVIFNEIMPSPEGADETNEWIEIFNQNSFEVNLSGWKIADTAGKTNIHALPEGAIIGSNVFLVLSRQATQIVLNNDVDGLNLIRPDGKIIDSVAYQKAPFGQSYNKTKAGWKWSDSLTPGRANIISVSQTAQLKSEEKEKSESKSQKTEIFKAEGGLAAVGKNISKQSGSLFIFLIALFAAICFGTIILILKRKIKNKLK